jgi:hypothetical protein
MDDLIGAMVGSVVGIVLLVAVGAVIGAGWLLYKLCELVLPPLFEALDDACLAAEKRVRAWWREVTWRQRVVRAHNETIQQIEAVRCENVETVRLIAAYLEHVELELPQASESVAVPAAVRRDGQAR